MFLSEVAVAFRCRSDFCLALSCLVLRYDRRSRKQDGAAEAHVRVAGLQDVQ